ncbi:MAG: UPF0182 family protein [Gemmatimonadales bacterium]
MSPRTRRIALIITALVLLLFLGRWTATLLADRWWATAIAPEAGRFISRYYFLRLLLDLLGLGFASLWFVGNFYIVNRTIGSVQVPRRVANLEINEALTPRALLAITVGLGLFFGLLTGLGASGWADTVMLAWHGVTYGITEPVLGHDLGLYLSQLPLWRRAQGFALLLILLGLGTITLLYVLVGAVRWSGRHPAVSDHARRHLGWLLTLLALALAIGYLLEPYEAVAGFVGSFTGEDLALRRSIAPVLTGVALTISLLSAVWAVRARHTLLIVGWLILLCASLVGRQVAPRLAGLGPPAPLPPEVIQRFERMAFELSSLDERRAGADGRVPAAPASLSLWDAPAVNRIVDGDSANVLTANQGLLPAGVHHLPVWFVLRRRGADSVSLLAISDTRTTATGGPTSFIPGDTLPYPGAGTLIPLPRSAVRPFAPSHALVTDAVGVPVTGWPRRLALAWARQAGELFGQLPEGVRLTWNLDPETRLRGVAPYLHWGAPRAVVSDDRLLWVADGYILSGAFPLVERVVWRDRRASLVRASFLGVIDAVTGETRIYLRDEEDPLARAWSDIGGVARPISELSPRLDIELAYPDELFAVQAQVMERPRWLGTPLFRRAGDERSYHAGLLQWANDGTPYLLAPYGTAEDGRISAVLTAEMQGPSPRLRLVRTEGGSGLPSPRRLSEVWSGFATYDRLLDSLRTAGVRPEVGEVRYWLDPGGVGAYEATYGFGPQLQVALTWVAIARGEGRGAGRNPAQAFENMAGLSAPLIGVVGDPLTDARRYMGVADSALRRGDWTAFGRAFEALREILRAAEADSGGGEQ